MSKLAGSYLLYLMENQGEIILYQPDSEVKLEVRIEDETVWLNRQQLSELFNRDVKTIGKHVNNALKEELAGMATVAKFATVQKEGDRTVTRQVKYYNLDMVLSVGYRDGTTKGGLLQCDMRLFAVRFAAFCNAKGLINRERKKFAYSAERFC